MASFNISTHWGKFMAEAGFRVEANAGLGTRKMRLFAPEGLRGKAAKKWFNKVFWVCHDRKLEDNCEYVIATY